MQNWYCVNTTETERNSSWKALSNKKHCCSNAGMVAAETSDFRNVSSKNLKNEICNTKNHGNAQQMSIFLFLVKDEE